MSFITTNDGVKIYYEERGYGKPLVLIHGWACSGRFFVRNIDVLAQYFQVINMDLRGHGKSDKPSWGYRISRMAKDVKDLIEALNLNEVNLLGWSMGAAIIWSYIDLFGNEHLNKIILVDQSPRQYYAADWCWGQPWCYDAETLAVLSTQLRYDPEGTARATVAACLTDKPTPKQEGFFIKEIVKCPAWIQATIMADHTHLDWRDLLPHITLPTLVIVGRKSKVFPWEGSAYVGEHIPSAKTVFFEKSGHMPFYEEAEKFNRVVKEFIS